MKLLSLFFLLLSIAFSATAQFSREEVYARFIAPILEQQKQRERQPQQKTTGIRQRLIGYSHHTQMLTDSGYYRYSSTRGSYFDLSGLRYNDMVPEGYPATMEISYDSVIVLHNNNGLLELYQAQGVSYNTQGKIASHTYRNLQTPVFIDTNYFNALGNMDSSLRYDYNGTAFILSYRHHYQFDGQDHLLSDTILGGPGYGMLYHYNNDGLLDSSTYFSSSSPFPGATYSAHYYPDHNLAWEVMNNGGTITKDSFSYDPTHQFIVSVIKSSFNGLYWEKQFYTDKHLNAIGLPDTLYGGGYGGNFRDTTEKYYYVYNSFNNPVMKKTVFQPVFLTPTTVYFYYENFFDAVEDKQSLVASKLYPNPARDAIYITTAQPYKQATLQLYNTTGACTGSYTFASGQPMKMEVKNYAPGLYYYRIVYDAGEAVSNGKFVIEK